MAIDSEWFYRMLEEKGTSARALADFLNLDPSSVSRMLKGERKMSAEEQDGIAAFLGLSLDTVAMHRRGEWGGFGEQGQEALDMGGAPEQEDVVAKRESFLERIRHRMAGTVTVAPGVDLTAPADPEWGRVYDDEHPISF
ncbi:helix-turn-helix domain-containing protein [Rhizobium halophytocola]|uniref:Transcriptional regulator with XRE-family HTH domain n=1 Tax=Rhizobium halophytocola TaxID=735519 RepID=A0ABS4E377_9HYPH|nr:helix-turn-helix transcriptional regulator [Rhizobium halophytocola]MBP1852377.1 transcriptional regulator with XRE-family HTH domain [Rhizobium halophytocola]